MMSAVEYAADDLELIKTDAFDPKQTKRDTLQLRKEPLRLSRRGIFAPQTIIARWAYYQTARARPIVSPTSASYARLIQRAARWALSTEKTPLGSNPPGQRRHEPRADLLYFHTSRC